MKAVIMAGGEGTRLRPLTCGRPKPMVPIANRPVMEHIVELLKYHGITDIAATLQYMPDMIKKYFGDGSAFNVKMRYYIETKPLGTAGSVKNAENFLDDTFLVVSGDALTDIDIKSAFEYHKSKKAMVTIILKRVDIPLEYGVVVVDKDGRIIRFLEKPGWGEVFSDTVNTGIYILSPEIFKYMKPNQIFDFSKDLFPILLSENKPLYGYITENYWCDIGDTSAYNKAHEDIMNGLVRITLSGDELQRGIYTGRDTIIEKGANITSPCIIGAGCHIREGACIGPYTVIGDNCVISEGSGIKKSIVWKSCTFDMGVQLRGSIICDRVHMKQGAYAFEQSVAGEYSIISEHAVLKPGAKIWPDKLVEPGIEISTNVVWGSKAGKQLFGNRGVTGDINTDITPEFAARLGAAYGAVNGKKSIIGISSDEATATLMIKNAFTAGLISSGVQVNDFKRLLLPSARSAVRFYKLDGGIHIGLCPGVGTKVVIDFLDKRGNSIDRNMERKIESAFVRDDFNRCEGDCLREVKEINGFHEFYIKNILNSAKSEKLDYKIALITNSEFVYDTVAGLLNELGCQAVRPIVDNTSLYNDTSSVSDFCNFVKRGSFDLGVSIEEACEKMLLVDSKGRLITEDMFVALISLVLFKTLNGGTVVVPQSASRVVDVIASEYNGNVVRTKTSTRDIMGRLLGKNAKEELLEQFTMHFDAIAGLVKLLDFMTANCITLSELVDMIPSIHMHKQEVECRWNDKGKVIRRLIQENSGSRVETLDGVKVYNSDGGWVLVLPDAEKAACSIISEGASAEFAEELTNIYVRKVREISRS